MKILAWPRAIFTPLLIAILGFLGSGIAGPATSNGAAEQNAGEEYPLPDVVTEWHQVIVTVERALQTAHATRHDVERQRLLSVMSRQHGKWTPSHPRYRLLDALHGFTRYYEQQKADVDRWRRLYQSVSPSQNKVLEETVSYSSKFRNIEQKLAYNQHLCNDIVEICLHFYNIGVDELKKHMRDREAEGRQADKISVSQALKHIVRDWTEEGSCGRDGTFACLLATLKGLFPKRDVGADKIRVLLPGAGLGRLGHEIDQLGGFEVTLNEWSMCVNAAYRFLEAQDKTLSRSMSPFVDGWSHHSTNANMVRVLGFPDVALRRDAVLLVEGDFTATFKTHSQYFDVVVTYFFIDTARNLMSYLDTIKDVLKQGGVWINLGPLLYGTAPLVQLSLEDLVAVSERMGFEFLETDEECGTPTFSKPTVRSIVASYDFDSRALIKNAYQAQFWAARRL